MKPTIISLLMITLGSVGCAPRLGIVESQALLHAQSEVAYAELLNKKPKFRDKPVVLEAQLKAAIELGQLHEGWAIALQFYELNRTTAVPYIDALALLLIQESRNSDENELAIRYAREWYSITHSKLANQMLKTLETEQAIRKGEVK